ncbi:MAG: hypothetical protein ACLPSW_16430 [Roseiarcus sp.]
MNIDRAWFRKNRHTNFRIRRGAEGEVEELFRRSMRTAGYELALSNGALPDIGDDREFRVCVINAAPDILLRMPIVCLKDAPDELGHDERCGTAMTIVMGERIIMDRIAG